MQLARTIGEVEFESGYREDVDVCRGEGRRERGDVGFYGVG